MSWVRRLDRAAGGLWVDLTLYGLSAVFAWWTAVASTLAPHRAWGALSAPGFAAAAIVTAVPLLLRRRWLPSWRAALAAMTWAATCVMPLCVEVFQRAAGRNDRAQEEVLVIEDGARRLLETGTPYLGRPAISTLPDQILGYLPYQPGMAVFGVPRGLDPAGGWWSDARVWFAIVTFAALVGALNQLRSHASRPALVRALQAVAVLPVVGLTLATGGDDLPVLALCLLGLALAATGRFGGAGLALGAAASLKLFAWPVALIVAVYAVRGRRGARYLAGAIGLPVLTALPALLIDPAAFIENVIAYPFGRGLVTSPATSPLPGHLIATNLPPGDVVAKVLLVAAAVTVAAALIRRPPATAAEAAAASGLSLLVAMLLLPATRFGYLLYPAALLLWVPALRGQGALGGRLDEA